MLMTYVDRLISKGGRYFSISRGGRVDFLHIRMRGPRWAGHRSLPAFWSVLIINRKWWWWSSVPEAIEDDRGLKKVSREQGPEEGVRALNKATNHAGLDKSCHQWTSINHGGNYHSVWKWQPCIIMGKILLRGSIYPVNTTWYRPVVHNLKVWNSDSYNCPTHILLQVLSQ